MMGNTSHPNIPMIKLTRAMLLVGGAGAGGG
jgi:hypothetical protein